MGLLYLGAALIPLGHTVKLIDMRFHESDLDRDIKAYNPDVIGISGLTPEAKLIEKVARISKAAAPKALLVIGGPHATAYWDRVLDETGADVAVIGEGEITFPALIDAWDKGRNFDEIPGVVYRRNGELRRTDPRPFIEDLDAIPMPAWDLMDIEKYFYDERFVDLRARRKFMAVFTSRGCPYNCIYCHQTMGKRYRMRSPENILKEIQHLYDHYDIREIEIEDDSFNLDRERSMDIFQGIIDSGMDLAIAFRNGVRGDRSDTAFLRKMREAGTYHIGFGIEAGTERVQKVIRKNLNIPAVLEAMDYAVQLGMFTRGFFMLGFPTERREEIMTTIEVALRSRIHVASFFIVNAFRGTPIYQMAQKMGKTVDIGYDQYDYNVISHSLCEVPVEELVRMQRMAYMKFYGSPSRIARIIRDVPNKRQIGKYFKQLVRRMRLV